MPRFYKWGCILFGIVAISNAAVFYQNLVNGIFIFKMQIVSAFASLLFNYLLFGFFFYLYYGTKSSIPDDQFEKEFMKGGKKNDTAKTKTKARRKN